MQEKEDKNIQISEISFRINYLMEYLGLNQKDFAYKINVGTGRLSNVLKGRNKPDTEFVTNIIKSFRNVNPIWLLLGEGDVITQTNYTQNPVILNIAEPTPQIKSAQEKIIENLNDLIESKNEKIKHLEEILKQKDRPKIKISEMKAFQKTEEMEMVIKESERKNKSKVLA